MFIKKFTGYLEICKSGFKLVYYEDGKVEYFCSYFNQQENYNIIQFLIDNLSQIKKRIKTKKINLIISEDFDWILYKFDFFPFLGEKELQKVVENEFKKYLTGNIISSQKIIYKNEEIKKNYIFAVGLELLPFLEITKIFEKNNFKIEKITFSLDSLLSVIKENFKDEKTYLFIDIDHFKTNLLFYKNQKVIYGRKLNFGIFDFYENIGKELNLISEKSKEILQKEDIIENKKIFSILELQLKYLIEEIKIAIDIFKKFFPEEINKIYLSGEGIKLNGLNRYLSEKLSINIEPINNILPNLNSEFICACPETIRNSFFDLRIKKDVKKIVRNLLLRLTCFFLILYFSFFIIEKQFLKKIEALHKEILSIRTENFQKSYYPEIILNLAIYIPKETYLEKITFVKNKIEIEGFSLKKESVGLFYSNLLSTNLFENLENILNLSQEKIGFQFKGKIRNEKD